MDALFPLFYPSEYEEQRRLEDIPYRAALTEAEPIRSSDQHYTSRNIKYRLLFTPTPLHPDLDFQVPKFWGILRKYIVFKSISPAEKAELCRLFHQNEEIFAIRMLPSKLLGTYCRAIYYLGINAPDFQPFFVLRAIENKFEEGESLTRLARYFPKKIIRVPMWHGKNKFYPPLSLVCRVHERIWKEGDMTYMLLHCAKGKNLYTDYLEAILHADELDISSIRPIYFKLGILLGQFFKRYLPFNPLEGASFASTVRMDLNPPNIFYHSQTERFEIIDLSDWGDSINCFASEGMLYSLITLLSLQIFGAVFLDGPNKAKSFPFYRAMCQNPRLFKKTYNEIRQFYEIFCDGFVSAWHDQPRTVSLMKMCLKNMMIFPYRSEEEAFDHDNGMSLRPDIKRYIQACLKHFYG